MDFNDFLNNLCRVHDHLGSYEWDEMLGEMPSEIAKMTFKERVPYLSELHHRVKYLIQNIGESAISWYRFKNRNKSFVEWLDYQLNHAFDSPWAKYENRHHSLVERLTTRGTIAPWRYDKQN